MIEKNIPMPGSDLRGRPPKYLWRECKEVGDSFESPTDLDTTRAAVKKFNFRNKHSGLRFMAREFENHVRVWRVQ